MDGSGARPRELSAVAVVLAAAVAFQLSVSRTWGLLTQIPWLDECITSLVVDDPSYRHGLAAIRGGVENTPPGYFTVMWPIARIFGGLTVVQHRLFGCFFAILASVAVYATCRLFMDRLRALVGALILLAHPIVIVQLFMVRFYTFWLAATAWLVYVTVRQTVEPERRSLVFARCSLAALAVSTHWFGIIGVGLITGADFFIKRGARQRLDAALPMIVGVLALAAFYPFLAAQRSGLTVATWIEPYGIRGFATQLRAIAGLMPMALIVAMVLYRIITREPLRLAGPWKAVAPGFGLLLFPAVLILFSVTVQPVAQAGYMLTAIIPMAIVAGLMTPDPTPGRGRALSAVALAAVIAIGAVGLRRRIEAREHDYAILDRAVAAADSLNAAGVRPIVFLRDAEYLPLIAQRPELAAATAVMTFDGDGLPQAWLYQRDGTRRLNRAYPRYRLISVDSMARLPELVVFTGTQGDSVLKRLVPGRRFVQVAEGIHVARER